MITNYDTKTQFAKNWGTFWVPMTNRIQALAEELFSTVEALVFSGPSQPFM